MVAVSFLAVGDWGAASDKDDEREDMLLVAKTMAWAADALRPPPLFILALGDNFYEDGVASASEQQWEATWRSQWLDPHPSLRIPWVPILGNHDYHQGIEGAEAQVTRTTSTADDEWALPR